MIGLNNQDRSLEVIATSPINIALVKYWGKVDEDYIIPWNSSLSITIDQNDLCSKTRIRLVQADESDEQIELILNGKKDKVTKRIMNVVNAIRERTEGVTIKQIRDGNQIETHFEKEELLKMKIMIESENNFATASGLASSSSGLSCLSFALAELFGVKESFEGEYSTFARLGSGSACRSLYGGFVQWHCGFSSRDQLDSLSKEELSRKSIAKQIDISSESMNYWLDNLQIAICCVKPEKDQGLTKEIPSTDGMKITIDTSELMRARLDCNLPQKHIEQLTMTLENRDFNSFAEITIKETNQLHAVCLDSYPPIFYINERTKKIIKQALKINKEKGKNIVAYSIDAGFHVFLFIMKEDKEFVLNEFKDLIENDMDRLIQTRIGREGVKIIKE
ncbi:diphosphomevalonate decarboxylase [Stylonychia lemnae]|uniref:Diphosphomevalonate decarboxylase n=1 Tax=Stylonychia lemnae TaxID=5949 RepID=A0A078B5A3_STYLE|nr:diphosphomevalonate decarboxylase [Stylonychia lemnae]|eukprot:CDW88718.1 diphosphomevalonate decarboxylase [Stylonychia lemnae]